MRTYDSISEISEDKDLVFVDIEATDNKGDQRIIQFSGYRLNIKKNKIRRFNKKFNPDQEINSRIKTLLNFNKNVNNIEQMPKLDQKWAKEIYNFVKNAIVVTFTDFDIKKMHQLFSHYEFDLEKIIYFDIYKFFEKKLHTNAVPSLFSLGILSGIKIDFFKLHNALYDAFILKEIFLHIRYKTNEELYEMYSYYQFLPKIINSSYFITNEQEKNKGIIKKEVKYVMYIKEFDFTDKFDLNFVVYKKNHHFYSKPIYDSSLELQTISSAIDEHSSPKVQLANTFFEYLSKSAVFSMKKLGIKQSEKFLKFYKTHTNKRKIIKVLSLNLKKEIKPENFVIKAQVICETLSKNEAIHPFVQEYLKAFSDISSQENENNN
ncbi:3'-5' exonuclease [Ureaplasma urealyticum]|uniref:3'-5' exonuclease n=1 Tax=Ureaplasma urealyticum TaxID=2130 RepID=A0AAX1QZM8_UREUR|nr:3'-5' exonuclease [Ureaplasma urealyticum]RCJ01810.1 3'-5' exonuclease [Ureaplasma urealyticum]